MLVVDWEAIDQRCYHLISIAIAGVAQTQLANRTQIHLHCLRNFPSSLHFTILRNPLLNLGLLAHFDWSRQILLDLLLLRLPLLLSLRILGRRCCLLLSLVLTLQMSLLLLLNHLM